MISDSKLIDGEHIFDTAQAHEDPEVRRLQEVRWGLISAVHHLSYGQGTRATASANKACERALAQIEKALLAALDRI